MDDFKNYKIMVQQGQADGQMHKIKQVNKQASTSTRTSTHTHIVYEAK
jgi:hypothetical protein